MEAFLWIKVGPCSILHGSLHGNPKEEKLSRWIAMASNSLKPNWFVYTPSSPYLAFQATSVQEWLTLRVWSKVAWAIAMLWHRWGERRVWGMVDGKNLKGLKRHISLLHLHTYIHTQTCTHRCIQTYRYTDRRADKQTYVLTYVQDHTCMHTWIHKCIYK